MLIIVVFIASVTVVHQIDPFSCRNHAESCGCPTFNGFTSDAELFENDNNLKV